MFVFQLDAMKVAFGFKKHKKVMHLTINYMEEIKTPNQNNIINNYLEELLNHIVL